LRCDGIDFLRNSSSLSQVSVVVTMEVRADPVFIAVVLLVVDT
jgi:hypothetical protein